MSRRTINNNDQKQLRQSQDSFSDRNSQKSKSIVKNQGKDQQIGNSPSKNNQSFNFDKKTILSQTSIMSKNSPQSKYAIQKYGLSLEPICTKPQHERSKLIYLCKQNDCEFESRLGCPHCFLNDHCVHTEQKSKIEEFLIELKPKYEQYYESLKTFRNVSTVLEQPSFITDILQEIDKIKQTFNDKLDDIRGQILQHFYDKSKDQNSHFKEEVERQKQFSQNMEEVMQKHLVTMNKQEHEMILQLYNEVESDNLKSQTIIIQTKICELEKEFMSSFANFNEKCTRQLNRVYKVISKIEFLNEEGQQQQKNEQASRDTGLSPNEEMSNLQKQLKEKQEDLVYFEELQQEIKEIENKMKELDLVLNPPVNPHADIQNAYQVEQIRKQSPSPLRIKLSPGNSRNVSPLKSSPINNQIIQSPKVIISKQIRKGACSVSPQRIVKVIQQPQTILQNQLCNSVIQTETRRVIPIRHLSPVPARIVYRQNYQRQQTQQIILPQKRCKSEFPSLEKRTNNQQAIVEFNNQDNNQHQHLKTPNVGTVPIFECCDKAFYCIQCHDSYYTDHKYKKAIPSNRYCLVCKTIFQTQYDASVPIHCVQCYSKQIETQYPQQLQ